MENILIIDDDVDICKLLHRFLTKKGYEVSFAHTGKKGLEAIDQQIPDLVFCDFRLQDTDGKTLLLDIKAKQPQIPVIIITGYSDVKMAVDVMKHGAYDYVTKPLFPEEILLTISNALNRNGDSKNNKFENLDATQNKKKQQQNKQYIFTTNGVFGEILKQAKLVAPTNYSVIIYGESGSGKESIAQHIHQQSKRSEQVFIAIDCGALSKELAASELFGHEKGAFTGALNQKIGSLELANGGTIFLDEIANLPYDVQVSLLRVVQERKMRRVGGVKDIELDIRIIVASNEMLYDATKKGKFREDLFHRFNEFSIIIPPLRDRKDDLLVYANFFLKNTNQELEKNIVAFAPNVEQVFKTYDWPGNLRELKNVVKRAALLTETDTIQISAIPFELVNFTKLYFENPDISDAIPVTETKQYNYQQNSENNQPGFNKRKELNEFTLKAVSIDAEYETIVQALKKANYNKSKAAKILDIDRKTLYNKMRQYKVFNDDNG